MPNPSRRLLVCLTWSLSLCLVAVLQRPAPAAPASTDRPELKDGLDNKPERLEWFRDLGFGMFIHFSLDSQIGSVISHSLAGASEDYRKRFFEELPKTFNPKRLAVEDWAVLAKLAGMKYVVFTTKHHSGFAMWKTRTTPFGINQTPFKRDLTGLVAKAFRKQGLSVGFYFSPEDFYWLHQNGKLVTRRPHPGVLPQENPGLMQLDRAQLRELATRYGPIDVWFLDGPGAGMRDVIWRAQPNAVITRDVIETPEQTIPGVPLDGAWESCVTMGTQWQYKPTHESYRSGTELIESLIETRAKGGNLLLNVGPHPDGSLPPEQEARLREIALWNFVYGESIDRVRPWVITNEGKLWFTKKKDENTVYVFVTKTPWVMGERKSFLVRSIRATDKTTVSVLGADGKTLEYRPDVDAAAKFTQRKDDLSLDVMMAQRIYNDRKWPNPLVIKLTHVEPALRPPVVRTASGTRAGAQATLVGKLEALGGAPSVEVGFEYRRKKQTEELLSADAPWKPAPLTPKTTPGDFQTRVTGLDPSLPYEFRAVAKHPLLTIHGQEQPIGGK